MSMDILDLLLNEDWRMVVCDKSDYINLVKQDGFRDFRVKDDVTYWGLIYDLCTLRLIRYLKDNGGCSSEDIVYCEVANLEATFKNVLYAEGRTILDRINYVLHWLDSEDCVVDMDVFNEELLLKFDCELPFMMYIHMLLGSEYRPDIFEDKTINEVFRLFDIKIPLKYKLSEFKGIKQSSDSGKTMLIKSKPLKSADEQSTQGFNTYQRYDINDNTTLHDLKSYGFDISQATEILIGYFKGIDVSRVAFPKLSSHSMHAAIQIIEKNGADWYKYLVPILEMYGIKDGEKVFYSMESQSRNELIEYVHKGYGVKMFLGEGYTVDQIKSLMLSASKDFIYKKKYRDKV